MLISLQLLILGACRVTRLARKVYEGTGSCSAGIYVPRTSLCDKFSIEKPAPHNSPVACNTIVVQHIQCKCGMPCQVTELYHRRILCPTYSYSGDLLSCY